MYARGRSRTGKGQRGHGWNEIPRFPPPQWAGLKRQRALGHCWLMLVLRAVRGDFEDSTHGSRAGDLLTWMSFGGVEISGWKLYESMVLRVSLLFTDFWRISDLGNLLGEGSSLSCNLL